MSLAANVPLIVMCHPSVPAKDLKEFVAFAKEQNKADKGVFYGSTGPGSVMHLSGETLKRDTGIKMDHVPFRGAAPLVQELLVRPHPARRRPDLHLARACARRRAARGSRRCRRRAP